MNARRGNGRTEGPLPVGVRPAVEAGLVSEAPR